MHVFIKFLPKKSKLLQEIYCDVQYTNPQSIRLYRFFRIKIWDNESFTMKLRTSTGKQYFFIKDNGTFVKLNKHKLLFNYSPL